MAFPEKPYDRLHNLWRRWGVPQEDVYCAVENDLLRTCIWLPLRYMERGVMRDRKFVYEGHEPQEGFMGVRPKDFHHLASTGCAKLRIFRSIEQDGHVLRLAYEPPQPAVSVRLNDLVVLQQDRIRFEKANKISASSVSKSAEPESTIGGFIASNDYRHVTLGKQEYHLGDVQAQIIEQLHDASSTDNSWVHVKTLLHVAGSRAERMRDIFKNKPHWRELVVSNRRGYYRLNIPDEGKKKAVNLSAMLAWFLPYLQDVFELSDCVASACTA